MKLVGIAVDTSLKTVSFQSGEQFEHPDAAFIMKVVGKDPRLVI